MSFHPFESFPSTISHSLQPLVSMLYKLTLSEQAYLTGCRFIYLLLKQFIDLLCLDLAMIDLIYLYLITLPKQTTVMLILTFQIILNSSTKLNAHVQDVHFLLQVRQSYFPTLKSF